MVDFRIRLPSRSITHVLVSIALWLATVSIIGKHVEAILEVGEPHIISLVVRFLNINREGSLPTWYATILLLCAAGILAMVALVIRRQSRPYVRHWAGLAIIFTVMSIDEATSIHEKFTAPLQDLFHAEGFFYFAWVLIGIPAALIFVLFYVRFLLHLPSRTRTLFILAGVCYVGGAIGIEVVGANRWYLDGGSSLLYSTIGTIEELCEMLGVITLIYALLDYLAAGPVEYDNTMLVRRVNRPASQIDVRPAAHCPQCAADRPQSAPQTVVTWPHE